MCVKTVRVKGRGDVRRNADALCKAVAQVNALALAHVAHEPLKGLALHAGDAVGAGLLLIGQDADAGLLRVLDVEDGLELRIGADPVVVAVGAD